MRPIAYIGAIATAIAIGIAGSIGNGALAQLSTASVSFGSQDISAGPVAAQQVVLSNPGTSTLTYVVTITGPNASEFSFVNPCGDKLGGGSSCTLTVGFDPSVAAVETATLTITDNAPGSPHMVALDGTGTGAGALASAHQWLSTTGSDTCVRNGSLVSYAAAVAANPTNVCLTYQKAYSIAQSNDDIGVKNGVYASTNVNAGAVEIGNNNGGLTNFVHFRCADSGTDTVDQSQQSGWNFSIDGGVNWVAFHGRCFHFRILRVNNPGDGGTGTNHVLFDNVHIDSFQFPGTHNLTVQNSQIGPSVDCYRNDANGPSVSAANKCSNWANFPANLQEVARWWAGTPNGGNFLNNGTGEQMEPYIHDRGAPGDSSGCTQGTVIQGDSFHDMQSADSIIAHTGGLLIDGSSCQGFGLSNSLTIQGNSFYHNMVYSIEMDGPMSGTTIQNNWIGHGYGALGQGTTINPSQVDAPAKSGLESGCRAVQLGASKHVAKNILIRYNSSDGFITVNGNNDASNSGCWVNVREIGNIFMDFNGACVALTGVLLDYNVANNNASCGTNSAAISAYPFTTFDVTGTTPINFNLTGAVLTVPQATGADYALSADYNGSARSANTFAGAVGP